MRRYMLSTYRLESGETVHQVLFAGAPICAPLTNRREAVEVLRHAVFLATGPEVGEVTLWDATVGTESTITVPAFFGKA